MNAKSTRLAWVTPYIRKGRQAGTIPPFGSFAWCRLPDTDPRKVAAVCIAAECWAVECDPATIRQQLEDEFAAQRWLADEEAADADNEAEKVWRDQAKKVVKISTAKSWAAVEDQWAGAS